MSDVESLRPDIAAAWESLSDKTFIKQSVQTLEERLDEGETVAQLVGASYDDSSSGLLVLTGRRLFFYARSRRTIRFVEIPWQSGGTVTFIGGWLFGKVHVVADGETWEFLTAKSDGERFAEALRTHTFTEPHAVAPSWYAASGSDYVAADPAAGSATPTPSPEEAIISGLERLGELHERGILDEGEFRAAKADLLRRLSER